MYRWKVLKGSKGVKGIVKHTGTECLCEGAQGSRQDEAAPLGLIQITVHMKHYRYRQLQTDLNQADWLQLVD